MPLLSFEAAFAGPVRFGSKRQSIRRAGLRRWEIGQRLHLYAGGYRQKSRDKLGEGILVQLGEIAIDRGGNVAFRMAPEGRGIEFARWGVVAPGVALDKLAWLDGMVDGAGLLAYLGQPFHGWVLRWRLLPRSEWTGRGATSRGES